MPASLLAGASLALVCNLIARMPGFEGALPVNSKGLMYRYNTHDDFGCPSSAFTICTFWLIRPEQKRKIIGHEFITVFQEEAEKIGAVDFLVQGTIYPDVIESGMGQSAVIKSHHNVGGLPANVGFGLVEPLRLLFKDEVRALGEALGIPHDMVWRQPFPGPGLAIRILGDITEEKLHIVRESDAILREEIANAGLQEQIWQYFTVFTPLRTVGVMGDERTYDHVLAIRAVTSTDAMTVEAAEIPYPILKKIMNRIINEVPGVNRVVYDITSKPPGTIEWE